MARLEPPLRLGAEADAPVLAVLVNAASHGLAAVAWRIMAGEGADAWALGIDRQAARARDGLWTVVDAGAGPVAGLLAVSPDTEPPGPDTPRLFHPLVELEAIAPDALYLNVLATLPAARRRGHGARLLAHAEDIARTGGHGCLSLIVADDNSDARRLYARHGYRERAARPMVKEGWDGPGAEWLLLVKKLT